MKMRAAAAFLERKHFKRCLLIFFEIFFTLCCTRFGEMGERLTEGAGLIWKAPWRNINGIPLLLS